MSAWTPDSWRSKPVAQEIRYPDEAALDAAVSRLRALPPLVTSWEIERLRFQVAEAQAGRRFLLHGGDCAETLRDCTDGQINNKLKILLQMSLVLVHATKQPVIRIGRFAGQYAKPRSKPTETKSIDGRDVELPSYFGDLVNKIEFDAASRAIDPTRLVDGYQHAGLTLNYIRSLATSGFADLHHPEYWNLSAFQQDHLPDRLREEYHHAVQRVLESLAFMEALGETSVGELSRVDFYTSHEGLNLHYESAQTRQVPRKQGYYNLTTHLPWIGERTRDIAGAHVEFFRGIRNPIGVKVGPTADPKEIVRLAEVLNPDREMGRLILITRMGAGKVSQALPAIIDAVQGSKIPVLWLSDSMHGNTISTKSGQKTRRFEDIVGELDATFDVHENAGTKLGGIHFELTGEDVTECIGGASGVTEDDLSQNYETFCDPRLNYSQALEVAFRVANRFRGR